MTSMQTDFLVFQPGYVRVVASKLKLHRVTEGT